MNVEYVTPSIAADILSRNGQNRSIDQAFVGRLARDIRAGRWKVHHQGLAISPDGVLLDGQHRLSAIVLADIGVDIVVARGVRCDAFAAIDRGKTRTIGDIVTLAGYNNSNLRAAALRVVAQWERGKISTTAHLTPGEILAVADRHSEGLDSFISLRADGLMPAGFFVAIRYITAMDYPAASAKFFSSLTTGENIATGDPAFALRKRLLGNIASKAKLPLRHVQALVVIAWNKHAAGVRVSPTGFRWIEDDGDPSLTPTARELGMFVDLHGGAA